MLRIKMWENCADIEQMGTNINLYIIHIDCTIRNSKNYIFIVAVLYSIILQEDCHIIATTD